MTWTPSIPLSAEAAAVHAAATPIDLHTDTIKFISRGYDFLAEHDPSWMVKGIGGHVDLPRLRAGNMAGLFFGIWTFPKPEVGCLAEAHRQIDALEKAAQAGAFRLCRTADDIVTARQQGQVAALCGIEGAHCLERGERNQVVLERLLSLGRRGVRYLGLLHFSRNALGAPAMGWGQDASMGLTALGCEIVDACRDTGILIDLAHINRRGFFDAVARKPGPLLVSHTGVAGVTPHWRNIDDEQVRAVADSGGVIGVIFAPRFLGQDGLDGVVAHLQHLLSVAGPDAVALGSDWDGFIRPTKGLSSPTELPNLTEALLRAGLSAATIHKILGDNVLRLLRAVPPKLAA
ncbi:MAG: membrane dipeptidase [Myxococcales bacterium]|nr:membrane dipeptidase [Myxococcales bacterium]